LKRPLAIAASVLTLAMSGCFEVDYLLQAGEGQLDLLCRARNLEDARENKDLSPNTRRLLGDVPIVKRFATKAGLIPTKSYEDFVALDRRSVVWVVSAAPTFSLEPKQWWFPIVGDVPYLGWFDKHLAQNHAESMAADGWDVDMRGSIAYSTLGFFDDPVLSTMIDDAPDADGELANVILHESVHATVYVAGQSEFNEGLATFVGDHLTIEYLTERFGAESHEITAWVDGEAYGRALRERLYQAYRDLTALYKRKISREEMLKQKSLYLEGLRAEVGFPRPITNATLAHYDTYHGGEEAFAKLYEVCNRDIREVIRVTRVVTAKDFDKTAESDLTKLVDKLGKRCKKPQTPDRRSAKGEPTAGPSPAPPRP
jgi:predicted aminopeptidase